jgi:hypothetical protein
MHLHRSGRLTGSTSGSPALSQPPPGEGAGSFRVGDVPRWLSQQLSRTVEAALDRVFDEPLDVPTAEAALAQIESRSESGFPPALSGAAEWAALKAARGAMAGRLGRRVAGKAGSKIVGRAALPLAVALDVGLAARNGVQELQVLASYLIARLRQAGLPVDRDLVRRVTTGVYLRPYAEVDLRRPAPQLAAAVARRWATGAVPCLRRRAKHHARRRIRAIEQLDLRRLQPVRRT